VQQEKNDHVVYKNGCTTYLFRYVLVYRPFLSKAFLSEHYYMYRIIWTFRFRNIVNNAPRVQQSSPHVHVAVHVYCVFLFRIRHVAVQVYSSFISQIWQYMCFPVSYQTTPSGGRFSTRARLLTWPWTSWPAAVTSRSAGTPPPNCAWGSPSTLVCTSSYNFIT